MRARTDLWEPGASNRLGPPSIEADWYGLQIGAEKPEQLEFVFKMKSCECVFLDMHKRGLHR